MNSLENPTPLVKPEFDKCMIKENLSFAAIGNLVLVAIEKSYQEPEFYNSFLQWKVERKAAS